MSVSESMKRFHFVALFVVLALLWSCEEKLEPTPVPTPPKAPTAITLSKSSLQVEAAGGTCEITVTSPFIPQVEKPSWVTVSAGSFKDYTVAMPAGTVATPALSLVSSTNMSPASANGADTQNRQSRRPRTFLPRGGSEAVGQKTRFLSQSMETIEN